MGKAFYEKIRVFLKEKDLIYFMIAVYIGTLLNEFLTTFTSSVIIPIINMIIPESFGLDGSITDTLENLGFVELRKLSTDFISLLIAIFVSYYLIRFVIGGK